jgi:hypothetical protein
MLLETLDIKRNDILIYSQNIFDLENNFKIIYKDDPAKIPHSVSYGEVCQFVNEYTPKNLIIYRLLTNIPDFGITLSKYGFLININGEKELVYFDPVFAVKELEDYPASYNYDLRFCIQQVGLTTLNRMGNLPNYAEIYCIDMQAIEAKNQNDKVFADTVFSFEHEVKKEEPLRHIARKSILQAANTEVKFQKHQDLQQPGEESAPGLENNEEIKKVKQNITPDIHTKTSEINKLNKPGRESRFTRLDFSEDKDFDYGQIMKINLRTDKTESSNKTVDKVPADKKPRDLTASKKPGSFSSFLQNKQIGSENDHISLGDLPQEKLTNLFKSSSSLKNMLEGKENTKVILKLD